MSGGGHSQDVHVARDQQAELSQEEGGEGRLALHRGFSLSEMCDSLYVEQ